MANKVLEYATLSKPKHRLTMWAAVSLIIFLVPHHWLQNLSLWKNLGWETAPSIGLTRAYRHILHGDIKSAIEMNWLVFVVLLIGIPLLLADLIKIANNYKNKKTE